jgi:hypothetical protein
MAWITAREAQKLTETLLSAPLGLRQIAKMATAARGGKPFKARKLSSALTAPWLIDRASFTRYLLSRSRGRKPQPS